ncbi:MAG: hypothetical protein LBV60_20470 [Streptomyces sp.]|nr:hypothetical protein [Streptomyces sp.]
MPLPIRRLAPALALCCTLSACVTACGDGGAAEVTAVYITAPTPPPTTLADLQECARDRFASNAGLAAGAAYRWIVKPWKEGGFKEGAKGRDVALDKAGLAGAFAYNRLKAVQRHAQGDPRLAEAFAPLNARLEGLKGLPSRLRTGDESAVRSFYDVITKVRGVGDSTGTRIRIRVPSETQLAAGGKDLTICQI